jgi:hypothetical protein
MKPSSLLLSGDDNGQSGTEHSLIEVIACANGETPAQRRFQKLAGKIERRRAQLKEWQAYVQRYAQRISGEVDPLRAQLRQKQLQMALLMDTVLSRPEQAEGPPLGRRYRTILQDALMDLLDALRGEGRDEMLEVLRARHARPKRRQEPAASLFEDVSSGEALLSQAQRNAQEPGQERSRPRTPPEERRADGPAKDRAARQVSQSLREVFRRLVSALHPDREPDAAERERKNRLMQRVNQAYKAKDLLTLLGLQIEIAQIDPRQLSSSERLGQYNQILEEQLADLEDQVEGVRQPFLPLAGRRRAEGLAVQSVDRALTREIARLRGAVDEMTADLARFQDPGQRHAWLDRQAETWEDWEMIDLNAIVDEAEAGRRRGGPRSR